jgi:NAD(P)-dependent dehydrogenase (short-subunit alcohol dehydrogenase family)
MPDIDHPTVLITGATGDIGRALASTFADRRAARLALCDLTPADRTASLLDPLRGRAAAVYYRQVDVTDAGAVAAFTEAAAAELGGVDICIANAGIVERGAIVDLTPEAFRRQIDINLTGAFLTAQAAARAMRRAGRGGQIIFMSSWTQDTPRANIGAYCASKGGLKMLAKTLALELAADRIRVNLVAPGFVDAGLTGQNLRANPQRRPEVEASVPLGRLIPADELACAVAMLCSDDAAYLTGTTLLVDGGSSLHPQR